MKYVLVLLILILCIQCGNPKNINTGKEQADSAKSKTEARHLTMEDLLYDGPYVEEAKLPKSPFYGYFKSFVAADYYHAMFKLLDSTQTSLWMPSDKTIERQLIDNRGKLLKISYSIRKELIPEAGDSVSMETIKTIEVVNSKK